jgi:iron-sulfur cluster repair protein YtfE (RIC family)
MRASLAHLSTPIAEHDTAIALLAHDHHVINELLSLLDGETAPTELAAVHSELMREVIAHERAEDQVVLPAMRDRSRCSGQRSTELWADMIVEQHEEMGQLMSAMCGLDPAGIAFEKRSSALVFLMRAHMEDEEGFMFPLLEALFTPAELVRMATVAKRAKDGQQSEG